MIEEDIEKLILVPKKEKLISGLASYFTGAENKSKREREGHKYYEIWFNLAFEFRYIIIAGKNFVIDVSSSGDEDLISELYTQFKNDFANERVAESKFHVLVKELEFKFFSDCWEGLEERIGRKIRCFLIEGGVIRGIDVNNRVKVEGDEIEGILNSEGIPHYY